MRTLGLIIVGLVLTGCSRPKFEPVLVTVVDDKTLRPVAGATVTTVCMGLSPYVTNTYVTDLNGKASVMRYTKGISSVAVSAVGYAPTSASTVSNGLVVTLKQNNSALR